MPAQPPLDAKTLRKAVKTCGWPVRRPDSSTTWTCSLSFGHRDPHKLIDRSGAIKASAAGFA